MTARQRRTSAVLGLLAGFAGCAPPALDQVDEGPVVGVLSGEFSCPVADGPAYDLGPATFDGSVDADGVQSGLRTQGCVAQVASTTRGDAIQLRLLQHTGFQRGQVLELHLPLAALDDDLLFDGTDLVFVGRGGFGGLLLIDGGDAVVAARTVGGAVSLTAWGTEAGQAVEGSFGDLRMGLP